MFTNIFTSPSLWLIHSALIAAQMIFGAGSIIGKIGLPSTNPVVFALVREATAGPLLCSWALLAERTRPGWWDLRHFILPGFCMYLNQFCYIVGTKLSNPVLGAAWQPSQPLITATIAILLGWERATCLKVMGICLAAAGAVFMVTFQVSGVSKGEHHELGNFLFFLNCLGNSVYVLCTKPLMRTFPPVSTTAWSYCWAAVMMAVTAAVVNNWPYALEHICPDCKGRAWHIPVEAVFALVYYILFLSTLAYAALTWANQFAQASNVLVYSALQPLTAVVLAFLLIRSGYSDAHPKAHLEEPGWNALGGVVIIGGLAMVIYDSKLAEREAQKKRMIDEDLEADESSGDYQRLPAASGLD